MMAAAAADTHSSQTTPPGPPQPMPIAAGTGNRPTGTVWLLTRLDATAAAPNAYLMYADYDDEGIIDIPAI